MRSSNEEAVAAASEGVELHVRAGLSRQGQSCLQDNAANALCALGRPRDAAELIGEVEDADTSDTICLHIRLAKAGLMQGEPDRLLAHLRAVAASGAAPLPETLAWLATGEAERARIAGPDPSRWRDAAGRWRAIGRRYEATYAAWRRAQALAATRGQREELEGVLREAHATAGAIGAAHLAEAVEVLARRSRVGLPGTRTAEGAFPELTSREREVLAPVADGRTNREIASELFIAEKTASVHVSNILAKLGAANRGQAAALAHRAGIARERELSVAD